MHAAYLPADFGRHAPSEGPAGSRGSSGRGTRVDPLDQGVIRGISHETAHGCTGAPCIMLEADMRRIAPISLIVVPAAASGGCAIFVGLDEDYYVVGDGAACALTDSGPVSATANGQVIERLRITSTSGPALTIQGFANVVVRDCEILHSGGHGILFRDAPGLRIERVRVEHAGAPTSGANPSIELNNIEGHDSAGITMTKLELVRGSSGVWLTGSSSAKLSMIEGYDFRGPPPRGQLVDFEASDDGLLEDFSCECPPDTSFPEENVSSHNSKNLTIRRGLLVGNNSVSGAGVKFLNDGAIGGLVEDFDTVDQGNASFSIIPGHDITLRRTRARDNHCQGQGGRAPPSSGGLVWHAGGTSSGLALEDSSYDNLCNTNVIYDG